MERGLRNRRGFASIFVHGCEAAADKMPALDRITCTSNVEQGLMRRISSWYIELESNLLYEIVGISLTVASKY